LSTAFGIYLVVEFVAVVSLVITAPLDAVVGVADQFAAAICSNWRNIAAVGAAPVPAAPSPAAAQSVYMPTAASYPAAAQSVYMPTAASSPAAAQSVYMPTAAAAVVAARVLNVAAAAELDILVDMSTFGFPADVFAVFPILDVLALDILVYMSALCILDIGIDYNLDDVGILL